MPAIRSPEASLWCDYSDDRVEKTPSLVDNVSEPFVVSVGEISLERGGAFFFSVSGIFRNFEMRILRTVGK
jgi:hypothetical protein